LASNKGFGKRVLPPLFVTLESGFQPAPICCLWSIFRSEKMHYEFVPGDEKVIGPGRTVKRIRAIAAIALLGVSAGDLGGYVESAKNLSGRGS
jgi:hypothetical protein